MEGTGVYWKAPFEALEDAGIRPELFHAQHVKQIRGKKTDVNDSLWLARICQFGLAQPSYVPPRRFRHLRQLTRYRRKLVAERSRNRNRVHKTIEPPSRSPCVCAQVAFHSNATAGAVRPTPRDESRA